MSSSKPAMNIIYSNPIVENKSIADVFSKTFNPCGPINTPEMINPMIPGILSFFNTIGDNRMINKINEKINIGFFRGM